MKAIITVLIMLFFLGGCATTGLKQAKDDYVECLKLKDDLSECERLRRVFEAELEAWKAVYPGGLIVPAPTVIIKEKTPARQIIPLPQRRVQ